MAYMLDYDLEDMLGVLSSVVKEYAEGSKERDATELAQIALYYIYSSRKQDDFNEFYKRCFDPSLPKIEIAHEFATR
ncbi:MAG TPA: hypothetical protein VF794_12325, partial [Archangium sp.]